MDPASCGLGAGGGPFEAGAELEEGVVAAEPGNRGEHDLAGPPRTSDVIDHGVRGLRGLPVRSLNGSPECRIGIRERQPGDAIWVEDAEPRRGVTGVPFPEDRYALHAARVDDRQPALPPAAH